MSLNDDNRLAARAVVRVLAFVAGTSPTGSRTIDALRAMADAVPGIALDLEVVDVLENPDRAELDRIIATPTVIRIDPLPRVRLVGDLSPKGQRGEICQLVFDT